MRNLAFLVVFLAATAGLNAQDCGEEALTIMRLLKLETEGVGSIGSLPGAKEDYSSVHGKLVKYSFGEWAMIRLTSSDCRFVDVRLGDQVPSVCEAVELTEDGRRIITREERIERCVTVSIDEADHAARRLFDLFDALPHIKIDDFGSLGTELVGCGGGFCYVSRWAHETRVNGARISISNFSIWINPENGKTQEISFSLNSPCVDGIVDATDASRNASSLLPNSSEFSVAETNLFQLFDRTGESHRFWSVVFRATHGDSETTIFVNAVSGEPLEAARFHSYQRELAAW
jgi:hypothetical protein